MRAIILAGGEGTRLRPLTETIPKSLVPVQGRSLTDQHLAIYERYGVRDFTLSISYLADQMRQHFGDGSSLGYTINYLEETTRMGTAGPLVLLKRSGALPTEDFFMSNADNLFALNLDELLALHQSSGAIATIALTRVEDPSRGGVARLNEDRILEFVEKPKKEDAPSNYLSSGFYVLSPEITNYIPEKDFVMLETDVWPVLAREGKLSGYRSDAQWFDTGTPERYAQVEREWRSFIKK